MCGIVFSLPAGNTNTNNQQNQPINMKPTRTIHINGWEINKYENYSKVRYYATYRNELGEIVKDFSRQRLSVVKEIIKHTMKHGMKSLSALPNTNHQPT